MKEQLIDSYIEYIKSNSSKGLSLHRTDSEVLIIATLFNYKIFTDIGLFISASVGLYFMEDTENFVFLTTAIYILLLGILWTDFRSINKTNIDFHSKSVTITSRNIFQKLLTVLANRQQRHEFKDIKSFKVRSNESFKIDLQRYFVEMTLVNDSPKTLIGFTKEDQANHLARFLTQLISI